ncbi:hypothetical protein WK70_26200 [Burkholderia cepacia]|nr:hypothetical protein WK70_26200 [Burkholderia cepacia]
MEWADTSIARQHIHFAKCIDRITDQVDSGLWERNVAFDGDSATPFVLNLCNDVCDCRSPPIRCIIVAPVIDYNVGAFPRTRYGDRSTDSA